MRRKLLKEKRLENKLTQKQIAKKVGVTERMYQHVEAGTRNGNYEIWDNLEDLLKTPQRQLRIQEKDGCSRPQ